MLIRTLTIALLAAACVLPAAGPSGAVRLENDKVRVLEVGYDPGVPRERYTRPTDQLIVFLDDCEYQRTDSATGAKELRHRKAGEVIWHHKGEDAPVLVNTGTKPYRTLVIELKQ
jgi:hypothetical protein